MLVVVICSPHSNGFPVGKPQGIYCLFMIMKTMGTSQYKELLVIASYNSKNVACNTNIILNWWPSSLLATLGWLKSMTLFHMCLLTKFWRLVIILQLQLPTHMVCIDILGQSIKVVNTYFKLLNFITNHHYVLERMTLV